MKRSVLVAVLPRQWVTKLLDDLRKNARIDSLTYWVEHVDVFGRLTAMTSVEVKPMAE